MEKKLCSACGKNPRADQRDKSTNTQCSECKYETQKRWTMAKTNQQRNEAMVEGIELMREFLAKQFDNYKIQHFSGPEIAAIIRRCASPKLPEPAIASEIPS
jgi:hypothetical protein